MSYFRHAPLAYWAAALVALVALLVIGVNQSSQYSPVMAVPATSGNSAEQAAYELAEEVSGVNVAFMSGDAQVWAADFSRQVRIADALYRAGIDGQSPALDALWNSVLDASDDLASYRGDDPMKRQQLASQLGTAVFALAYQYRQE